jgi:hypothetical protein
MLMINESSLSMVEIGLDSNFKAFYIKEEKRKEKKRRGREREAEKERERESSNERNGLCRHSDKGDRERMTLFTFLDLCEGKRQKKKAYYYYYFFLGINWSYFTMSLLYWGLILEALSFYRKKDLSLIYLKKIRP